MNVYDFDKTIYVRDSSVDFIKHCMLKYPAALVDLPKIGIIGLLFALKICKRETFKQCCFKTLRHVPDVKAEVKIFWDGHMDGIKKFYLAQKKEDDLVISASPDFLIDDICTRLGIKAIASSLDTKTGKLYRPNCWGAEKVVRFKEIYPNAKVDEFYSDSYSDTPMAKLAQKAFIVKGEHLLPW